MRIWSRDWNANPEREVQRVIEAVKRNSGRIENTPEVDRKARDKEKALFESTAPVIKPTAPIQIKSIRDAYPDRFCFFMPYRGRLRSAQYQDILSFIAQDIALILAEQGPTSVAVMMHQICRLWGYARISDRLERKIYQGIQYGVTAHSFLRSKNGRFLYANQPYPIKIRLAAVGGPRPIEEYCPEELYLIFWLASQASGGSVSEDGAVRMAANALGFQRVTEEIMDAFRVVLDHLDEFERSPMIDIPSGLVSENGVIRTNGMTRGH